MHLLPFWVFLQSEMIDFRTVWYASTSEIHTRVIYVYWGLKMVPPRAEPPRLGHYREYPHPPPSGVDHARK